MMDTEVRDRELRMRGIVTGEVRKFHPDQPRDPGGEGGGDEDLDEDSQLLLAVLDHLDGEVRASFNPAQHPRNPKGAAGGGRFRSLLDRITDALHAHHGGNSEALKEFDREQLRKVAVKRGITLRRGAGREEIAKALLDDLKPGGKPDVEEKPAPAEVESVPPMLRELQQRSMADLRRLAKMSGADSNGTDPASLAYDIRASRLRAWRVPGETDAAGLAKAAAGADEELRRMLAEIDAAKPPKAAPRKKAAPKPEPLSDVPAIREVQVDNRVREAYVAVLAKRGKTPQPGDTQWVGLADLRAELGELDRTEVDASLKRFLLADGSNLVPESNQKTLTPRDRGAAVNIGDQDKHAISIEDPSPRPLPEVDKPAPTTGARTGDEALALTAIPLRSEAERRAFRDWAGGYVPTNHQLRQHGGVIPVGPGTAYERRITAGLDSALARSVLAEDIVVTRGIDDLSFLDGPPRFGQEWLDHGFNSTAAKRPQGITGIHPGGAQMRITVPAGTHAVSGPGLDPDEILLDRGLSYRVTTAKMGTDGVWRLDVEVVPKSDAPDPEQAARDRQAHIDKARNTADVLSRVAEMVTGDTDPDVLTHQADYFATKLGPDADPSMTRLFAAMKTGDKARIRRAQKAAAAKAGLTEVGTGRGRVAYDRKVHETVDSVDPGASVQVLRPGYSATIDGEQVQLSKALVVGVDEPARAPRKAAPRAAPAVPRVPAKKATPKAPPGRPPATPTPIHDLIDADDATIETALRDVYEGKFGPYTTKATVHVTRAGTRVDGRGREHKVEARISVGGKIYDAQGVEIGNFERSIGPSEMHYADGTVRREVWAEHHVVELGGGDYDANPTKYHGKGFGGEFNRRAIEWYRASGVHGIGQSDHNGYVWASQGFNFGGGGAVPAHLVDNMRQLIADLRAGKTKSEATKDAYHTIPKRFRDAPDLDAQLAAAEALLERAGTTQPGEPGYPTAYEISQLGRRDGQRGKTALWLGKLLWVSADEMILNPDEGEILSP